MDIVIPLQYGRISKKIRSFVLVLFTKTEKHDDNQIRHVLTLFIGQNVLKQHFKVESENEGLIRDRC
jgi:hypothetical protein